MPSIFSKRRESQDVSTPPAPHSAQIRAARGSVSNESTPTKETIHHDSPSKEGGKFKSLLRNSISADSSGNTGDHSGGSGGGHGIKSKFGLFGHTSPTKEIPPNEKSPKVNGNKGLPNGQGGSMFGDFSMGPNGGLTAYGADPNATSNARDDVAPDSGVSKPTESKPTVPLAKQKLDNMWAPLQPDGPKKSPSPVNAPESIQSTSQPAVTQDKAGEEPARSSEDMQRRGSDEEPLVSSDLSDTNETPRQTPRHSPILAPLTTATTPAPPTIPTPAIPLVSPIPGMEYGPTGKLRPAMPNRRTTVLHSPPMPQPIRNLPTLQGWSGFNQASMGGAGGVSTPGWGNREGGLPRTPGWGGGTPSAVPRTPLGGGFPFALPSVGTPTLEKGKSKGMSEEELKSMRRAMVSF